MTHILAVNYDVQAVCFGLPHTRDTPSSRSLWRGLGSTLGRDVPFSGEVWLDAASASSLPVC